MARRQRADHVDVLVVGAGFAGMYQLRKARELGLRVRVVERGDGVGGTWYWNRYPGARCDAPSLFYSVSYRPDLDLEWHWSV
ncbi:MAG: NAD(P)-binding protein, partial [Streptomycetaceae bacterium]|nr:NAD(P)-binding protein [Streptomycetaceae bacterium]